MNVTATKTGTRGGCLLCIPDFASPTYSAEVMTGREAR